MTQDEIIAELKRIDDTLCPLMRRKSELEAALRTAKSLAFIAANCITREQVVTPDDGPEWFGHIVQFGEWLKKSGCDKRWVAWNGQIHYASDVVAGIYQPTVGQMSDLKS